MQTLLKIEDLSVDFSADSTNLRALDKISFDINKSEVFALVGESGSGKTITCMSILNLLPPGAIASSGRILFEGKNLLNLSDRQMLSIRGRQISIIFQEPLLALNPVFNIGNQISEVLSFHLGLDKTRARNKTLDLLARVGMPAPQEVIYRYPHQLSGGMRQRAMIAQAIACGPKLLLADEPTSSLDVTIQVQILNLFKELIKKLGISILLVTHDLGIVSYIADRIAIIEKGRIIEMGQADEVLNNAKEQYTKNLIEAAKF